MTVSEEAEQWPEQVGSKTEESEGCGGVPGIEVPTDWFVPGASQSRSVPNVG